MGPRTKLDTDWRFQWGDAPDAWEETFDDSDWRWTRLPHDWSVEGPFAEAHYRSAQYDAGHLEKRADGYLPKGVGWYRKRLDLDIPANGRVYLEFEGVFRDSALWVNGCLAGRHASGYTGAVYDITPWARPKGRTNVLALRVNAEEMEGWWYEGAGVYRHVWLMVKPSLHLAPWGTVVTTSDTSRLSTIVHVRTRAVNAAAARNARLRTVIADDRGNQVGVAETETPIGAGQDLEVAQEILLTNPRLWSPDSPNLYTARSALIAPDGETDAGETVFGVRWFAFTAAAGFFLNGEPLRLRGGNIHHDFGGLGTALPDRANEKTIEALKEMGCDIIRSAHNPASPSLMDACDRLGMLFWAETRNLYVENGALNDLRDLIVRDRNHPCVIVWGLANTAGSPDDRLTACLRQLHAAARQLDPTRPTAVALEGNADANANGFAEVTDVVGYNGGGMKIDDRDHLLFPHRATLISEYASGRGARGVYEDPPPPRESERLGDGRVVERGGQLRSVFALCLAHEREWEHIAARPWLSGGLMWSAIEYRGETNGWPIVTSQFGALDICRFPKDLYYFYRARWTDRPTLHLFPHWTWPGREGRPIEIWCYSNCDAVTLYLNGKRLPETPDLPRSQSSSTRLTWRVPYEPGVLRAEGRIGDQVVCRQEIRTSTASAALRVSPDRADLRADGEDLSFIAIRVEDAAGASVPTAAVAITVNVTGSGRLIGLSSGNPAGHESEKGPTMTTFNGLCLAIVQNDGRPGEIAVTVSCSDFPAIAAVKLICHEQTL